LQVQLLKPVVLIINIMVVDSVAVMVVVTAMAAITAAITIMADMVEEDTLADTSVDIVPVGAVDTITTTAVLFDLIQLEVQSITGHQLTVATALDSQTATSDSFTTGGNQEFLIAA